VGDLSVRVWRIVILFFAVFSLVGCAIVDSSVAPRSDTVSRNFANARNEAILLNIVRASHNDPLSFSAISQAIPQMSNGTNLGLPTFMTGSPFCPTPTTCSIGSSSPGRGALFGNQVASDSVSVQTQFTLSTQETHDFYNALLRPVDLYIVNFFIRQGYPRELLFWLFADKIKVKRGSFVSGVEYNPPYSYGCPDANAAARSPESFRDWAEIAVVAGLSVEERVVEGHGKDGKSSKSAIGRLCFDEVAGREGIEAMKKLDPERYQALFTKFLSNGAALRTFSPKCGESWKTVMSKDDRLTMRVSGIEFEIVPRSPYGMYQFLGKLMAQGARPPSDGVTPPGGDELPLVSTVADDSKIINIRLGGGPDCFITTMFRDGEYCVPNDAANTKRIIGLLAALTALQTTATDLAITPVVHTAN
jgi:hypothetical protein